MARSVSFGGRKRSAAAAQRRGRAEGGTNEETQTEVWGSGGKKDKAIWCINEPSPLTLGPSC